MMKILASVYSKKNIDKNKLLVTIDTETKKYKFHKLNIIQKDYLGCFGLCYSGDNLIFSIYRNSLCEDIVMHKLFSSNYFIYQCNISKGVNSIVSVFPGKIYMNSFGSNTINYINFNSETIKIKNEDIYFKINWNLNINSLYSYRSRWYASLIDKNNIGVVAELNNDRFVYSYIKNPISVFFNENHRMCFLEKDSGLFHCGDDIWYVGRCPTSVIEDIYSGGYWIASKVNDIYGLSFFDYHGNDQKFIPFNEENCLISNMLEARGIFK